MSVTSQWEWTDVSTDRDNTWSPLDGSIVSSKFDWKLTRTRTSDAPFVTAAGAFQLSGSISAFNAGATVSYTPPIYSWYDGVSVTHYYSLYCQDDTVQYQTGGVPWYKETQLWSYSTGWIPASKL